MQELKLFFKPRDSFRGTLVRENSRARKLAKRAFSSTGIELRDVGSFRSNGSSSADVPHRSYSPSERSTAATEPPPTVDGSNHSTTLVQEPIRGTGSWLQDSEFLSSHALSTGWKVNQQSSQEQLDLVLYVPSPVRVVEDGTHRTEAIGSSRSASKWRRLPKIAPDTLDVDQF